MIPLQYHHLVTSACSDTMPGIPPSLRVRWNLCLLSVSSYIYRYSSSTHWYQMPKRRIEYAFGSSIGANHKIVGKENIRTISVLPRLYPRPLIVEKMQQRRPDLPTRVQLVAPHAPRLVPFQRVEEQDFVRFRDFSAVVRQVQVHG